MRDSEGPTCKGAPSGERRGQRATRGRRATGDERPARGAAASDGGWAGLVDGELHVVVFKEQEHTLSRAARLRRKHTAL